jgi:chromosome segregation ATPase
LESERRRCETLEAAIDRLEAELVTARKSTNTASEELLHRALAAEAEARKQGLLAQQVQHALDLAQKDANRLKDDEARARRDTTELRTQLQNAKSEAAKWRKEAHSLEASCEEAQIRAEASERELASSRLLTLVRTMEMSCAFPVFPDFLKSTWLPDESSTLGTCQTNQ